MPQVTIPLRQDDGTADRPDRDRRRDSDGMPLKLASAAMQQRSIAMPNATDQTIEIPARPEALSIPRNTTALIVVDMQNAYLSKGGYLDLVGLDVGPAPKVIAGTRSVIEAARAARIPTIYLQNGFSPDMREVGGPTAPVYHKSNALIYMRQHPSHAGKLITKGTWDFEFVEGIRPAPGEIVVPKARYSGFAGTDLDQILRARHITHLLLVGVNTNVCVESTLRDAYHREYFALMVADATFQSGPSAMMDATVFNVEKFFGWVSSTNEVCASLRKAARSN
jgi:ureidoacrylate peracid hydrolase